MADQGRTVTEAAVLCFMSYIHAIDQRRWADAGAAFDADGVLAFGVEETVGPEAIAEKIELDLARYTLTEHLVATPVVTQLDDGTAVHLTASAVGLHLRLEADAEGATTVGGRYEVDMRETDGGWRLTRVAPAYLWRSGPPLDH